MNLMLKKSWLDYKTAYHCRSHLCRKRAKLDPGSILYSVIVLPDPLASALLMAILAARRVLHGNAD